MAKKASAAKTAAATNPLVEAIATVKRLQAFLEAHGSAAKAVDAVESVRSLVELTGGFAQLKQALEIVGEAPAPATEA